MNRSFNMRTAVFRFPVFLVVLTFLSPFTSGDAEVSCVFMERCILPCSFQAGSEEIIHWIWMPQDFYVHSFYHNQDQLAYQNQKFRNRTSLFKDQISGGDASLQLTGIQVQDQGRYKCYTSTIRGNKESFINLKVYAPVSKINIEQVENRITCSSEGIYPEPELTWSTNPPSTFKNTTRVQQTEQQLYNISSSLILSDNVTDVDYSCSISTHRNKRRTTLLKPTSISCTGTETSVPCTSSNTAVSSLIWRFNHRQIILTQTRPDVPDTVSEWRQHVKSVSESGGLRLKDLSSKHEGTYTCELSNNEETFLRNTLLFLSRTDGAAANVGVIPGVVVAVLVLAAAAAAVVGVLLYRKHKDQQRKQRESTNNSQELNYLRCRETTNHNDSNTQQQESNTDSVDAAQS